ncbi:hypothetical protein bsdtb5_26670 [Anaeromicropila herbilytica]|uniref:Uncharacterized protein n=1 Tax=Anaeromicropila herbilytica TaxID=2785025 RepID=A0A7R7IDA7_9FIRM|nr:hypothetical protein bsdtb5_26670 [Anaeromicropila herbilytica]
MENICCNNYKNYFIILEKMNFAREVGDRIIFMDSGEIIEENTPEEFFKNPTSERAKQFLAKVL